MDALVVMLLLSGILFIALIGKNLQAIPLSPHRLRPHNNPNLLKLPNTVKIKMEKLRLIIAIKHKLDLLIRLQMFQIAPIRIKIVIDRSVRHHEDHVLAVGGQLACRDVARVEGVVHA